MRYVPRIVHGYWVNYDGSNTLPKDVAQAIETTRSIFLDYDHFLWHRESCIELLKKTLPENLPWFKKLTIPAMQSDIARLLVLYKFGGIYMDASVVPRASTSVSELESVIGNSRLTVFESTESSNILMNRFIAAEKGSSAILNILEAAFTQVRSSVDAHEQSIDVWALTGSRLSNFIKHNADDIKGLNRVSFERAHSILTRRNCEYKMTDTGNWLSLQTGRLGPVYRSQ